MTGKITTKENKKINILSGVSKDNFFKMLLKRIFLKPPFIGEIIVLLCIYLAIMNIMVNSASISNLGTICSSIAEGDEIAKYKSSIAEKFISDLKAQGISDSNLNLTKEEIENYAGINLVKLNSNDEGKNLIKGIELSNEKNSTSTYEYLDLNNNSVEVEYSYFSTNVSRGGTRYYARIGDLLAGGMVNGGAVNLSLFNSAGIGEYNQIPISNLAEPFLVKQSTPLYLYASTYNKDIVNSFVDQDVFNSEITFEKRNLSIGSQGTESFVTDLEVRENCKMAEVTFLDDKYKIGQLGGDIEVRNNSIYITVKQDRLTIEYLAEYESQGAYVDVETGYLKYLNGDFVTKTYSKKIGEYNTGFVVNVPNEDFSDYEEKSVGDILSVLNGIEVKDSAEGIPLTEPGERIWINEGGGKYSLYECFEMPYYTLANISMDAYLLKSAKTWFGNFYFENSVSGGGANLGCAEFGGGGTVGTKIETSCRYEVNDEAKKALLEIFKYNETDSSLSNISLFASYIERNAIENDDYNLKLVYYGLCRMFNDVEGVSIPLNEEIEEEFGNADDLQISTVPDYAYNILMSSVDIPDPAPLNKVYGMGGLSNGAEKGFIEYTMPYGACYRKQFPTKIFTPYVDLNQPSGFTLEEFYKIGEYYAPKRFNNLKNYGYGYITEEENLEYCLKLAETAYNLEQDIGINGVYILSKSTIEGGWAASYFSVDMGNLWGYGIMRDKDTLEVINHNTSSKIYPEEMDKKYSEVYQKCAYQVACYLKTRYLTNEPEFYEYLNNLKVDKETQGILNRIKTNQNNLKLKEINDTGNNLTEEEFNKLISFIKDEEIAKVLRAWRYWNGKFSDNEIGGFYNERRYGPTFYSIDNIYVHGWGYENKSYEATEYSNMSRFYQVAKAGNIKGGDFYEIAKECHDYILSNNFSYGYAGSYSNVALLGTGQEVKKIDCSAFVTWCLYEYGYEEFNSQLVARYYYNNMKSGLYQKIYGWEMVDLDSLQPGDILCAPRHVEIYAGDGQVYTASGAGMSNDLTDIASNIEFGIRVTPPLK